VVEVQRCAGSDGGAAGVIFGGGANSGGDAVEDVQVVVLVQRVKKVV